MKSVINKVFFSISFSVHITDDFFFVPSQHSKETYVSILSLHTPKNSYENIQLQIVGSANTSPNGFLKQPPSAFSAAGSHNIVYLSIVHVIKIISERFYNVCVCVCTDCRLFCDNELRCVHIHL